LRKKRLAKDLFGQDKTSSLFAVHLAPMIMPPWLPQCCERMLVTNAVSDCELEGMVSGKTGSKNVQSQQSPLLTA